MTDLKSNARAEAAELASNIKTASQTAVKEQAHKVRDTAAAEVDRIASAADAAADEFHAENLQSQALHQVASKLEGFAQGLKSSDIEALSSTASDFARKNPLLFVGGAAFAGFLVTRFLKASEPQHSSPDADDDVWAPRPPASGRGEHESVMTRMNGEQL